MNDFYMLFLFSFPFQDFIKYINLNDELIFIFKYESTILFCYKKHYYKIDYSNKILKPVKGFKMSKEDILNSKNEINYEEKEEIDISKIKDMKERPIIYLYKIYYIED